MPFGKVDFGQRLGGSILLGGDNNNNMMLLVGLGAAVIIGVLVYIFVIRKKDDEETEEFAVSGTIQSAGPQLSNYGYKEWDSDNVKPEGFSVVGGTNYRTRPAEACGSPGGRVNWRGCDNDFRNLSLAWAHKEQHGKPEFFDAAAAVRGENFADFPESLYLSPLESFVAFDKTLGDAPSIFPGVYGYREGMDNTGSMHSRNSESGYAGFSAIEGARKVGYPEASRVTGAAIRGQLVQDMAPKLFQENMADLPVFNVSDPVFRAEAFSPTRKYGYMKGTKRTEGFGGHDASRPATFGGGQQLNPFVGMSGAAAFVPWDLNFNVTNVESFANGKKKERYTNAGLGTNSYYRRKGAYADGVGAIVANSPYSSNRAQFLSDWTGATTISAADVINTTFGSAELLNSVGNLSKSELAEFSRLADTYTYEQLHAPIIIKALKALRELSRKGEICLGNPRGKEDVKAQIRQMLTQLEKYDMYVEDAVLEELVSMAKSGLKEKNGKMCLKVDFTQALKDRLRKLEAFVKKNGVAADLALYKALLTKASEITTKLIKIEAGFTPFNACRVKAGRARWDSASGRRVRHGLFTPSNSCDYNDYHKGGRGARSAPMPKQCRGHLNQMVLAINKSDAIESENAYRAAYNKMCACVQRVTGTDYCSGTERPGSVYSSYSGKVPTYDEIKSQYGQ